MHDAYQRFVARGGLWVLAQSVLMTGVIVCGVRFHGDWSRINLVALGAVGFVIGGYFGIVGVIDLGRNRTPFPVPLDSARLIQTGIYARVRHPLYTGVMFACLGWAGIWQSVPSFVIAWLTVMFFNAKARREERWLQERFSEYADYAKRVPRFIPRLGRLAR